MKKLDARSYRSMSWKNGGGTTTEILRAPADGSLDDFDWRISMARVGETGPFSRFAGVDRTIAILDDGALSLAIEGRGRVRLDRTSAPFSFPADVAVAAALERGALEDFNVMTRRGRFRHLLTRVTYDAAASIAKLGELAVLVVAEGEAEVTRGATREDLRLRDAVVLETEAPLPLRPAPRVTFLVVDLWRA
jgi:environmental stress-induced protein Ves